MRPTPRLHVRKSLGLTRRQLYRDCRQRLLRAAAARWGVSKAALKRALHDFLKPRRKNLGFLLRVARQAGLAGVVAGALLLAPARPAGAAAPIALSDVAAGTGGFAIYGIDGSDFAGSRVSGGGDINGDGVSDLFVGAPGASSNLGEGYIVFGKSDGAVLHLSTIVAGTGGFYVYGGDAGDTLGSSLGIAGDVNGDGLDDVVIGVGRRDPPAGSLAGQTFVIFGKASTSGVHITDVAAGTGGFVINGAVAADTSGRDSSPAGDVNGDGLADIIVGAPNADPGGRNAAGESYIVFGKAGGTSVQLSDIKLGSGGFVINGITAGDASGKVAIAAGDVNGDGLSDVILGSYTPSGISEAGIVTNGQCHVVFGKPDGTAVELSDVSDGSGGFLISGSLADRSAASMSGAGDVNGDGLADLIVGEPGADPDGRTSAGRAYVIFGKSTTITVSLTDIAAGSGGFVINGADAGDIAGRAVSGAGDVNGDGLSDILVGAPLADLPSETDEGEACVVYGKTGTSAIELSDVAGGTGGFVMTAVGDGDSGVQTDSCGSTLCSAGDVNGDGLADVHIGASNAEQSPYATRSGEAYLVFSPEPPPASAAYKAKSRAGDGAGGAIVPFTEFRDARIEIDFSDNDLGSDGSGGASLETVTITRNKSGLSNFPMPSLSVGNVVWHIATNRVSWGSAKVTLRYLDSEIAGIPVPESKLAIYKAPSLSGPWTKLTSTIDAARNEITASVTGFSYFAVAEQIPTRAQAWEAYR